MERNTVARGEEQLAKAIVHSLVHKGVKLLALDFDLTIIGIHTGGAWRGPANQLAQHVRPCFRALLEASLQEPTDKPLHLSVVTYSLQYGMIEDLLKYILPNSDTSKILIRTSCKDWLPKKNQPSAQSLGKQQHIAQVTTDLYNLRRAVIHPHEILLMDDDEENVNTAIQFGHLAYLVKDAVSLEDIYSFVERIKECDLSRSNWDSIMLEPACPVPNNTKYVAGVNSHQLQRNDYSAQVYLTSPQSQVHNHRPEVAFSEMPSTAGFTIPRPMVVQEQERRSMASEANARSQRNELDSGQQNPSAVPRGGSKSMYVVMTNGQ